MKKSKNVIPRNLNWASYGTYICMYKKVKVKWSRYRPGVAQRVGRGIALLFHERGTRMGWVVSSTPWPHFIPWKDSVPILQEAGWAPGPVWTGGKSRPHWDSIPERPVCSQSLYRLSYPAHIYIYINSVPNSVTSQLYLRHYFNNMVFKIRKLYTVSGSSPLLLAKKMLGTYLRYFETSACCHCVRFYNVYWRQEVGAHPPKFA